MYGDLEVVISNGNVRHAKAMGRSWSVKLHTSESCSFRKTVEDGQRRTQASAGRDARAFGRWTYVHMLNWIL